MSDTVIRVESLSKRYRLGERVEGYGTLRDKLAGLAQRLGRSRPTSVAEESFWALEDVSFEVTAGQVLGVIGANGAGKSTLLKILSRVTEPTEGRVAYRGRLASLLEVGTGFHPELTGRENVSLNAAILGMSRMELRDKLDAIVEFAGVGDFLDTPVKRYSSGMYVRLAFAVAAHIDPDILLIDEVLAVGDVAFQRKCLDKMEDVARGGRTVLFVSHNLSAVSRLCTTALLLRRGQLTAHGDVPGVLSRYMQDVGSAGGDQRRVRGELAIERISILGADADGAFHAFGACKVSVTIHAERTLDPAEVNFMIQDAQGRTCVHLRSDFDGCLPVLRPGRHLVEVEIDSLNLEPQIYFCWARVVCLKPRSFVDSERVPLEVHAEWPVHQGSQSVVAVQRRWSWREDS